MGSSFSRKQVPEENVRVDRSVDIKEEKSVRRQEYFVIQTGGIKMICSLTEAEKDFLASLLYIARFHFISVF